MTKNSTSAKSVEVESAMVTIPDGTYAHATIRQGVVRWLILGKGETLAHVELDLRKLTPEVLAGFIGSAGMRYWNDTVSSQRAASDAVECQKVIDRSVARMVSGAMPGSRGERVSPLHREMALHLGTVNNGELFPEVMEWATDLGYPIKTVGDQRQAMLTWCQAFPERGEKLTAKAVKSMRSRAESEI